MRAASNMLRAFQIVSISPVCSSRSCCCCRISRTDWEIERFPADSRTMKRSPGVS
ncbi:hypothetical protein D3C86_1914820 [compost metagenome]